MEVVDGAAETAAGTDRIDFFISRAGNDKDVAVLIARILQGAGYKTLLQDDDFRHTSFMAMMARGWSSGARLICVLSGDYQSSEHCKKEYEVALSKDPRNLARRVIVLRIAECAAVEHLADLVYTDLVPVLHDAKAFAAAVLGAVAPSQGGAMADAAALLHRAPKQIIHRTIAANPNFTGREEDLVRLDQALAAGRRAALTNSGHAAAVSGLGGVGKSVLAREFAWRHRADYQGIWWINAETQRTLLEDLIELGGHLFIPGLAARAKDDPRGAVRDVLDHLWQGNFAKPWLLIYDNVEKPGDLEQLTPRGGAHTLITTRWPQWDDATEIQVDVFPPDVARDYLMKRARSRDAAGAARLADVLGCLPLALDHAGSYIASRHASFASYSADLARFLDVKPARGTSRGQYPATVWGTFNIALDRVISGDAERGIAAIPEAERLMRVLAFVDPLNFPLDAIQPWSFTGIGMSDIEKGEAVAALHEVSLIRRGEFEDGRPHVSVHRLVQQVMRSRIEEAGELSAEATGAMYLLNEAFQEPQNPSELINARRLAAHAAAVLQHAPTEGEVGRDTSILMSKLGSWQFSRGDRAGALPYLERALAIREALVASDPDQFQWQRDVSISLTRVADVRVAAGDRAGALQYFERALGIAESLAAADPEHPEWQRDVSIALNRIADVRLAAGDRVGALEYFERALGTAEKLAAHNPDRLEWQRDVSIYLNRIANVRLAAGDRAGALENLERALDIAEQLAATDAEQPEWQRDVSIYLNMIADVRLAAGDRIGALQYFERALTISEKLAETDPDRPEWQRDVSIDLTKIGDAHLAAGDRSGALQYFEKALAIRERLAETDPERPQWQQDVAASLDKITTVAIVSGQGAEAVPSLTRSLAIKERIAAVDPRNVGWQRSVALGHQALAAALIGTNASAMADHANSAIRILQDIAKVDPDNVHDEQAIAQCLILRGVGSSSDNSDDFSDALQILEPLISGPAGTVHLKRSAALCYAKVASGKLRSGDKDAALASFDQAVVLGEACIAADGVDVNTQAVVMVALDDFADTLSAFGDRPGTIAVRCRSIEFMQRLVDADRGNLLWQLNLALSLVSLAKDLVETGAHAEALSTSQHGLEIAEQMAAAHPDNLLCRRGLPSMLAECAVLKSHVNDRPGALALCQRSAVLCETLSRSFPDEVEMLDDCATVLIRLGDARLRMGDKREALGHYRRALEVCSTIETLQPGEPRWLKDLAFALVRAGDAAVAMGDMPSAKSRYEHALELRLALAGTAEPDSQHRIADNTARIGDTLLATGDAAGALARYRSASQVSAKLAGTNRSRPDWCARSCEISLALARPNCSRRREFPPMLCISIGNISPWIVWRHRTTSLSAWLRRGKYSASPPRRAHRWRA